MFIQTRLYLRESFMAYELNKASRRPFLKIDGWMRINLFQRYINDYPYCINQLLTVPCKITLSSSHQSCRHLEFSIHLPTQNKKQIKKKKLQDSASHWNSLHICMYNTLLPFTRSVNSFLKCSFISNVHTWIFFFFWRSYVWRNSTWLYKSFQTLAQNTFSQRDFITYT